MSKSAFEGFTEMRLTLRHAKLAEVHHTPNERHDQDQNPGILLSLCLVRHNFGVVIALLFFQLKSQFFFFLFFIMPAGFFLKPYNDTVIYAVQNKAEFFVGDARSNRLLGRNGQKAE